MHGEKTTRTLTETVRRLRGLSERLDPRYMTAQKAMEIYKCLSRYEAPPTRILEIGTFCGTGAIMLAAMVEPWGGHVTTVDLPWSGKSNPHFRKTVDDWATELRVGNLVIVRREDGAEGLLLDHFRAGGPPWDFIYVDGGHRWLHTCAQFAAAFAALRPGAWICFDDIASRAWPEVGDCWRHVVCELVAPVDRYRTGQLGFARRATP